MSLLYMCVYVYKGVTGIVFESGTSTGDWEACDLLMCNSLTEELRVAGIEDTSLGPTAGLRSLTRKLHLRCNASRCGFCGAYR